MILQMLPYFYNNATRELHQHLTIISCDTLLISNLSKDIIRMKLCLHSLKEKVEHWLFTLEKQLDTQNVLEQKVLKKFYPTGKTHTIREVAFSFSQRLGEPIHDACNHLKELLRKCLHYATFKWQLNKVFYDDLIDHYRQIQDTTCEGAFMSSSKDEIYRLFEVINEIFMDHKSFFLQLQMAQGMKN